MEKKKLPIVILVAGPAGAGKTTFGEMLGTSLRHLGTTTVRAAFASSLKQAVTRAESMFFDKAWDPRKTDWEVYEQKAAARPLLVELGKLLRSRNPDVFVEYLWTSVFRAPVPQVLIIEDWRYMNEYAYLAERAACVIPIHLSRYGVSPANAEEARSLREIDEKFLDLPSAITITNNGQAKDMETQVETVTSYVRNILRNHPSAN